MLAGVELLLAAIVLSSAFLFVGAFLIVVPADQAVVRSHALLAQLTFASRKTNVASTYLHCGRA